MAVLKLHLFNFKQGGNIRFFSLIIVPKKGFAIHDRFMTKGYKALSK
jgi:hypothetical protein